MTEPSHAVFLSYASEDAAAAQRISEALRATGVEVWFDQSELRGGDAWDAAIRKQIKACKLFIPIISRNTHARGEGYFRLEWKLAVDRSDLMATDLPFLLPVAIDDTPNMDPRVPERFRAVQWTRLPGGETSPAFVEHVRRLLSAESARAPLQEPYSAESGVAGRKPAPSFGPTRSRTAMAGWVIAAAVVVALAYFVMQRLSRPAAPAAATTAAPVAGAAAVEASIAVLPLTNESGNASQQYFSDGISQDLINALGQFPGLKVIGRISSFKFRNSTEDAHSIGAKLGVAHLLEGSVQTSGGMVRVRAELVDSADGTIQWSENYDRPYKDLFALQDQITQAVVRALSATLLQGAHAAAQSDRPPSGSLEAYDAFLQGRFYFGRGTDADVRKAIQLYTRATQLDPSYALAWSSLSMTWTALSSSSLEGRAAEAAYAEARETADRALTLSPDLAASHIALGYLLLIADLDWRGAEAEYRRALALAPNNGDARFELGVVLAGLGEVAQAIELTRQALTSEPLRANWCNTLAGYYSGLNRLDEAEQAIDRAIDLQPTASSYHETLAIIEVQRGDARAALAAARQEPPGLWQDVAFAFARQIGDDRSTADAALTALIKKYADSAAFQIAELYALRNDANATFSWLDRAWSTHDPGINYLLYDPFILRYRSDPRFAAFCRKVSLPVPAG
ncbi:MAG: TIR domain-containing protein [Steroidobacteraceae bacterium]